MKILRAAEPWEVHEDQAICLEREVGNSEPPGPEACWRKRRLGDLQCTGIRVVGFRLLLSAFSCSRLRVQESLLGDEEGVELRESSFKSRYWQSLTESWWNES